MVMEAKKCFIQGGSSRRKHEWDWERATAQPRPRQPPPLRTQTVSQRKIRENSLPHHHALPPSVPQRSSPRAQNPNRSEVAACSRRLPRSVGHAVSPGASPKPSSFLAVKKDQAKHSSERETYTQTHRGGAMKPREKKRHGRIPHEVLPSKPTNFSARRPRSKRGAALLRLSRRSGDKYGVPASSVHAAAPSSGRATLRQTTLLGSGGIHGCFAAIFQTFKNKDTYYGRGNRMEIADGWFRSFQPGEECTPGGEAGWRAKVGWCSHHHSGQFCFSPGERKRTNHTMARER